MRFNPWRRRPAVEVPPAREAVVSSAIGAVFAQFGVAARVAGYTRGPSVTLYEIVLDPGVKVEKVTGLERNIAYTLGTPSVRILDVIPGRQAIGIEVPNATRDDVRLADILTSPAASPRVPLLFGLGLDQLGRATMVDLGRLPHLLVAGATGSGKSVFVNAFLCSLLTRVRPELVRLVLVDPKRVELAQYADVPHLLTPVVTDPARAADALGWLVGEMDHRYAAMSAARVRSLGDYNAGVFGGVIAGPPMPHVVGVVDELADLMMVAGDDVEGHIVRLAQLGRAAGIHLVLATQRPTVDVVTGLIKANMPARLAFAVASGTDSRVILDRVGAEKLLGRGDALFLPPGVAEPIRIQAAMVSDAEIAETVRRCARLAAPGMVDLDATGERPDPAPSIVDADLIRRAVAVAVADQGASASSLQRQMRIGYPKAGRIIDDMVKAGVLGEATGPKPRPLLVGGDEALGLLGIVSTPAAA